MHCHRIYRPKRGQQRLTLENEVTEERLRACYRLHSCSRTMTFEEVMADDVFRLCIEMHARYGAHHPEKLNAKQAGKEQ